MGLHEALGLLQTVVQLEVVYPLFETYPSVLKSKLTEKRQGKLVYGGQAFRIERVESIRSLHKSQYHMASVSQQL